MTQLKLFTNSLGWIITLGSIPVVALVIFTIQTLIHGARRSQRVQEAGGSILLNKFMMEYGYWWLNVPTKLLLRWKVSANAISFAGLAVVMVASVFVAFGYFGLGGALILMGSLSDMMDGILARGAEYVLTLGRIP